MTNDPAFVHSLADCQSRNIGHGSHIWQFTVVLPGARIGTNCNINSHCFIENDVCIGNDVTIKCGCYIWDGTVVEDKVFIGPNVTFTNDKHPRSRNKEFTQLPTVIRTGASVGGGVVILPGLTIGEYAVIGAGAVVTEDVPAHGVVYGEKARLRYLAPEESGGTAAS